MYQDNKLIPNRAARLLTLGVLATGNRRYAELAFEVRQFIGRMMGPSLDVVASPLELLKVEGLIEAVEADKGLRSSEKELLRITDDGRAEMKRLLTSNVRPPVTEFNRLVIALKMRFMHLLDKESQRQQFEVLVEMAQREYKRLQELREQHPRHDDYFASWLEQEIEQSRQRVTWFRAQSEEMQKHRVTTPEG